MPRNASQVYAVPVGTDGTPNTIIFSGKYNTFIHDVETDLNTPRPVVAGGTGSTSADGALINLSAEKAAQVVTNWDSAVWMPGSFYAATTASGAAPVAGHAFSGTVIINEPLVTPPTNQNVVVEARDMTDPAHLTYYRIMTAGVWGPWLTARQSVYAAPFDALAYSGMQINGSMEIDQEHGGSLVPVPSGGFGSYIIDGWSLQKSGTSVLAAFLGGNSGLAGFKNSLAMQVTTPQPAIGADTVRFVTKMEGYRTLRAGWGASAASPVTVSFWVQLPVVGTYRALLSNFDSSSLSAWMPFTITAANTWQYITLTFAPVTSGTWKTDNGIGMILLVEIASSSTPNAIGSAAALSLLTGVVILPGAEAPSAARSSLIMRPYDQELATCKRYWQKLGGSKAADVYIGGYATAGNPPAHTLTYSTEMRALPTGLIVGSWTAVNASALTLSGVGTRSTSLTFNVTASGIGAYYTTDTTCFVALDARL